jgi:hypothetical protein
MFTESRGLFIDGDASVMAPLGAAGMANRAVGQNELIA